VREEVDDILSVVQLIGGFLLQEGEPERKQGNASMFRQTMSHTHTHTHTHTHARTRAHACTHARTHAHTRAHTHTHTHTHTQNNHRCLIKIYQSFSPTDLKGLTQDGHILTVLLHLLSTDVEYFGDARQLL